MQKMHQNCVKSLGCKLSGIMKRIVGSVILDKTRSRERQHKEIVHISLGWEKYYFKLVFFFNIWLSFNYSKSMKGFPSFCVYTRLSLHLPTIPTASRQQEIEPAETPPGDGPVQGGRRRGGGVLLHFFRAGTKMDNTLLSLLARCIHFIFVCAPLT